METVNNLTVIQSSKVKIQEVSKVTNQDTLNSDGKKHIPVWESSPLLPCGQWINHNWDARKERKREDAPNVDQEHCWEHRNCYKKPTNTSCLDNLFSRTEITKIFRPNFCILNSGVDWELFDWQNSDGCDQRLRV